MNWYADYPHIGYDLEGKKILKPVRGDEIDNFLRKMENPESWYENILNSHFSWVGNLFLFVTGEQSMILRQVKMLCSAMKMWTSSRMLWEAEFLMAVTTLTHRGSTGSHTKLWKRPSLAILNIRGHLFHPE